MAADRSWWGRAKRPQVTTHTAATGESAPRLADYVVAYLNGRTQAEVIIGFEVVIASPSVAASIVDAGPTEEQLTLRRLTEPYGPYDPQQHALAARFVVRLQADADLPLDALDSDAGRRLSEEYPMMAIDFVADWQNVFDGSIAEAKAELDRFEDLQREHQPTTDQLMTLDEGGVDAINERLERIDAAAQRHSDANAMLRFAAAMSDPALRESLVTQFEGEPRASIQLDVGRVLLRLEANDPVIGADAATAALRDLSAKEFNRQSLIKWLEDPRPETLPNMRALLGGRYRMPQYLQRTARRVGQGVAIKIEPVHQIEARVSAARSLLTELHQTRTGNVTESDLAHLRVTTEGRGIDVDQALQLLAASKHTQEIARLAAALGDQKLSPMVVALVAKNGSAKTAADLLRFEWGDITTDAQFTRRMSSELGRDASPRTETRPSGPNLQIGM